MSQTAGGSRPSTLAFRLLALHLPFALCLSTFSAPIPPAEQLLPTDTLAVFAVPDWSKTRAYFKSSPQGQLCQDPAMKPFKDKFMATLKRDLLSPIERNLAIRWSDYSKLVQGQITFAITQNGWDGSSGKLPGALILIDSRDNRQQLTTQLADLKKKWIESGEQIKTEKIRDTDLATLVVDLGQFEKKLEKLFPTPDAEKPEKNADSTPSQNKLQIAFAQFESLLVVGTNPKDVEKIIVRASGGAAPVLADQASFEANRAALFRNAQAYAWIHFKPVYTVLVRLATDAAKKNDQNPTAIQPDKILSALGLGGLQTLAFQFSGNPDGSALDLFLGLPESNREGLFRLIVPEAKDAAPPPFIPADAVRFSRWRIDAQKAWTTIESTLNNISPAVAGVLQMMMSTLGKDKDPDFDLKRSLIGNLGDDFISFEKKPRSSTLADLGSPPALFLIGSPAPDKLAGAIRTVSGVLPVAQNAPVKDREFLGRKIYSVALPTLPGSDANPQEQTQLHFGASAGYLAFSTDASLLEQYLRENENAGPALRDTPTLAEAAQKVGGMATGFFGFENQRETMRATVETLKNDTAGLDKWLALTFGKGKDDDTPAFKEWLDFSLLPSFDRISKYFHFLVYSGGARPEGVAWRFYFPAPPPSQK